MTVTFQCSRCGRDGLTIPRALCPSCRSVDPRAMQLEPAHDWRTEAACIDVNPEIFTPVGWGAAYADIITEAKDTCGSCTVREQCLAWAMDTRDGYAILGGLTPDERTALRRRLNRSDRPRTPKPIDHGTTGGYHAHLRRGESPCEACKEAKVAYRREWRKAKREDVA